MPEGSAAGLKTISTDVDHEGNLTNIVNLFFPSQNVFFCLEVLTKKMPINSRTIKPLTEFSFLILFFFPTNRPGADSPASAADRLVVQYVNFGHAATE